MKKLFVLAIVTVVTFVLAASAFAVGLGKTVEYPSVTQGKVVFNGDSHAKAGGKCMDCHPKIFGQMAPHKERMKITKEDHVPEKFCGTCHDGKKAFGQDEPNCAKCHKK